MLQAETAQLSQPALQPHMMESGQGGPVGSQPLQQHIQQTMYQQVPVARYHTPDISYGFQSNQGPVMGQMQSVYTEHIPVIPAETRRPRVSTGQTNENELKDMLEKNTLRSLEEVAADVRATDRTSTAEKTKQLFAMIW